MGRAWVCESIPHNSKGQNPDMSSKPSPSMDVGFKQLETNGVTDRNANIQTSVGASVVCRELSAVCALLACCEFVHRVRDKPYTKKP